MAHQKTEVDLATIVYRKNPTVQFELKKGVVTIIRPQNHWIQRVLRKLHFKIPQNTTLTLDDYGSFVFRHINGQRSVYQIGQALEGQFEEAGDYLYERLLVYLNHLDQNEHLVQQITHDTE
ncbi:PqqD family protein [Latilactobacillus fuchuensis]|jgi:hypothetical protein|uniref:Coenzyme PQQ synthesis protein D (PqqD) n=2 Tax=Latilactobacillus fuchuensis TaxID=164393 RepID=A0A2N9DTA1_9LACO|nr:PqqD family protein [Latilactobacillus fuchuensis]KRL60802.1 hypothetical protein FC69_GL001238 [Latilactobacillus fuchuensis DSM 14340 = JCM 11249]MCP8857301.1 PqqD family protein [Latilactobacillus fuchuensis]SPC36672.1 conserved hypothetical protein [Latilactobacillus fuchuensis]